MRSSRMLHGHWSCARVGVRPAQGRGGAPRGPWVPAMPQRAPCVMLLIPVRRLCPWMWRISHQERGAKRQGIPPEGPCEAPSNAMLCARNPEVDVTAIWRPTYPPCPRRAPSRLLSHAYVKMLATVEAGAGAPRVASSRAATSRPAGPFRMAARRSKLQLRTAAEPEQKQAQEQQKSFLEAVTEEPSAGAKPPKTAYVDELPPVKKEEMSAAMRERLRREYYSLGGAPNKAMTNWFLYIILFISFLAISASLTGAI